MLWDELKIPIYNELKEKWIKEHPLDVGELTWNYLFEGGKQIRPRLFCDLWNYLCPDSIINGELAFVIECIHVTSLIMDDSPWMDNASERRNKKTLHLQFSQKKVGLLCHDLLKMVYELWTKNKPSHLSPNEWNDFLLTKLLRLTIGQWYDLEKYGTLFQLASLKTGILFELITAPLPRESLRVL
mgnify:FL=1